MLCLHPQQAFPGSNGNECWVWDGWGTGEKSLGTRQMLCSFTEIFALLSSWRGVSLTSITWLATQRSSPRYLRKVLVRGACPEKFSQCLIVNGCLIAKVVPDNNELVPYIDGLVPNNDGLVPNNDRQVPNDETTGAPWEKPMPYYDELVPNNDSQVHNRNETMIWQKWRPMVPVPGQRNYPVSTEICKLLLFIRLF